MKLLTFISEYFNFLLVNFEYEIYSGRAFSSRSGVIEMKSDNLKIKFISERNQTFVEVGSLEGKDWCELSILRYLLDKTPISFMNLEELSSFLKTNLEKIENLYSERKNIVVIEELKYKVANKIL